MGPKIGVWLEFTLTKIYEKEPFKKIDHKYPNFDVEVGQKIALWGPFLNRRFSTIVSLVRAFKYSC